MWKLECFELVTKFSKIIVPLFIRESHCVLIVINQTKNTITYFDSIPNSLGEIKIIIRVFENCCMLNIRNKILVFHKLNKKNYETIQRNVYDCGPHICKRMELLLDSNKREEIKVKEIFLYMQLEKYYYG